MDISIIFKIAGVGIVIALTNQILNKNGREDIATLVTLAGVIIILAIVVSMIADFFSTLKTVFQVM